MYSESDIAAWWNELPSNERAKIMQDRHSYYKPVQFHRHRPEVWPRIIHAWARAIAPEVVDSDVRVVPYVSYRTAAKQAALRRRKERLREKTYLRDTRISRMMALTESEQPVRRFA